MLLISSLVIAYPLMLHSSGAINDADCKIYLKSFKDKAVEVVVEYTFPHGAIAYDRRCPSYRFDISIGDKINRNRKGRRLLDFVSSYVTKGNWATARVVGRANFTYKLEGKFRGRITLTRVDGLSDLVVK